MAAKFHEYKAALDSQLRDNSKPWAKYFDKAEATTGIERVYLFIGGSALTALYLVIGYGSQLICNSIGFVYPAAQSVRALESSNKDDDTKWLTYWVVFAVFSLVEFFADIIVGWFPMYWLLKCAFLIWCFLPFDYNGSMIIYRKVLRPFYLSHREQFDSLSDRAAQAVSDTIKKAT